MIENCYKLKINAIHENPSNQVRQITRLNARIVMNSTWTAGPLEKILSEMSRKEPFYSQ